MDPELDVVTVYSPFESRTHDHAISPDDDWEAATWRTARQLYPEDGLTVIVHATSTSLTIGVIADPYERWRGWSMSEIPFTHFVTGHAPADADDDMERRLAQQLEDQPPSYYSY